jgi:hypothetical protein
MCSGSVKESELRVEYSEWSRSGVGALRRVVGASIPGAESSRAAASTLRNAWAGGQRGETGRLRGD